MPLDEEYIREVRAVEEKFQEASLHISLAARALQEGMGLFLVLAIGSKSPHLDTILRFGPELLDRWQSEDIEVMGRLYVEMVEYRQSLGY